MVETFYKLNVPKYKNSGNIFYKIINGISLVLYYFLNCLCDIYVKKFYTKCKKELNKVAREKKIVVSMTTIPSRIENVPYVLRTLYNQTVMPDKIILWITDKVDTKEEILELFKEEINNGLEIRFIKDVRVHTKYYYAMMENPEDIVITIDDDIIYSEYLIERLYRKSLECPGSVIAARAHEIVFENEDILEYKYWHRLAPGEVKGKNSLLATGVGGVLYPPHCLYDDWKKTELFLELCPTADDIWLKIMECLNGTRVEKLDKYTKEVFVFSNTQEIALSKINVNEGRNDLLLKKCREYYNFDANLFR